MQFYGNKEEKTYTEIDDESPFPEQALSITERDICVNDTLSQLIWNTLEQEKRLLFGMKKR